MLWIDIFSENYVAYFSFFYLTVFGPFAGHVLVVFLIRSILFCRESSSMPCLIVV